MSLEEKAFCKECQYHPTKCKCAWTNGLALVHNRVVKLSDAQADKIEILKRLMVSLKNEDYLTLDMLYRLTDVFELDAMELLKDIESLKQKP